MCRFQLYVPLSDSSAGLFPFPFLEALKMSLHYVYTGGHALLTLMWGWC